jgi:hypothetical protein
MISKRIEKNWPLGVPPNPVTGHVHIASYRGYDFYWRYHSAFMKSKCKVVVEAYGLFKDRQDPCWVSYWVINLKNSRMSIMGARYVEFSTEIMSKILNILHKKNPRLLKSLPQI